MNEYRSRDTGAIMTRSQVERSKKGSTGSKWTANTHDFYNVDPIMATPKPEPSSDSMVVVVLGTTNDALGNWVIEYGETPRFVDVVEDGATVTAETQLADYRASNEAKRIAAEKAETAENHKRLKILGVEFNGVMYSATKEDQWGLASIKDEVANGIPINYEFENGAMLTLSTANWAVFKAVWVPFRQSFFL